MNPERDSLQAFEELAARACGEPPPNVEVVSRVIDTLRRRRIRTRWAWLETDRDRDLVLAAAAALAVACLTVAILRPDLDRRDDLFLEIFRPRVRRAPMSSDSPERGDDRSGASTRRPGGSGSRLALLALVFASGGVVGGVVGGYLARQRILVMLAEPDQVPNHVARMLRLRLRLTLDQAGRIEEIVRRRHAALAALRAETTPRLEAEYRAMLTEIDAVLQPDQRPLWHDIYQSARARFLLRASAIAAP